MPKFLTILALVFYANASYGCDVCGCASGGFSSGFLLQNNYHFLGLRYSQRDFKHPKTELSKTKNGIVERELYENIEIKGRFYLNSNWQLLLNIPLIQNTRFETNATNYAKGIGDINVTIYRKLFNSLDSVEKSFKHNLLLGFGIKLPTGKYQLRDKNKLMFLPAFQTGTGAYTFSPSIIYQASFKKVSLYFENNLRLNTKNEFNYQFGNGFNSNFLLGYKLNFKNALIPMLGITYEFASKDKNYSYEEFNTGFNTYLANIGIQLVTKKFEINSFFQQPIYQNTTEAQPTNSWHFSVGFSYFLRV